MESFKLFWLILASLVLSACTPPLYMPDTRPKAEVRFSLSEVPAEARLVYLLGDFTDWGLGALPMQLVSDGRYQLSVDLPQGVIYYKYAYSTSNQFDADTASYEDFPRGVNRSSLLPEVTEGQVLAEIANRWAVQGRSNQTTMEITSLQFEVSLPETSESLYVAGVINNWTHEAVNLSEGKGIWEYTLPQSLSLLPDAPLELNAVSYTPWLEYKYTLSNGWDHEEINLPPTGVENSNRVVYAHMVTENRLKVSDRVNAWK
ncbi:MAG: hypothetical protein R2880_11845 [Deinococcales bacterium]